MSHARQMRGFLPAFAVGGFRFAIAELRLLPAPPREPLTAPLWPPARCFPPALAPRGWSKLSGGRCCCRRCCCCCCCSPRPVARARREPVPVSLAGATGSEGGGAVAERILYLSGVPHCVNVRQRRWLATAGIGRPSASKSTPPKHGTPHVCKISSLTARAGAWYGRESGSEGLPARSGLSYSHCARTQNEERGRGSLYN